jgi:secreted trypsin-like serine protease
MKNFILVFLTFISLTSYAQTPGGVSIVGGRDALEEEFPWMVELISNNQHHCGGSLIAPEWVLTAAHCSNDYPNFGVTAPNEVIINTTVKANAQSYSEVIEIEEVFSYEDYDINTSLTGDIALLKLASPSSIAPVLVNNQVDSLFVVGDSATTMGWGITEIGGTAPTNLRVSSPLIKSITDLSIVAGFDTGETPAGSAQGDSGGPLFINDNGVEKVIGIVSYGSQPATAENYPATYVKVYGYKTWIDSVMNYIDPVEIEELEKNMSIFFSDEGFVKVHLTGLNQTTLVELININGQILKTINFENGSGVKSIDLSSFANGVYILRDQEFGLSKKFIIH